MLSKIDSISANIDQAEKRISAIDANRYPTKIGKTEVRAKIANAKEQAQKLANTLGIKLGKVTNIIESSNDAGGPIIYDKMAAGMGGAAANPQIEGGTQEISSVVTLYFEKR
jgi:uncharacterized protein YggE